MRNAAEIVIFQTQPKKVCSQIGMCTFDGTHGVSMGIQSVVPQTDRISPGGHQDATCSVCEMAIVWMQSQLKQNQTEEQIINYADALCDKIPNPMDAFYTHYNG
ncbi:unnamed protein product [Lathyrus sativus]|nr:unnamed protein product [Lathyrus sativus]